MRWIYKEGGRTLTNPTRQLMFIFVRDGWLVMSSLGDNLAELLPSRARFCVQLSCIHISPFIIAHNQIVSSIFNNLSNLSAKFQITAVPKKQYNI